MIYKYFILLLDQNTNYIYIYIYFREFQFMVSAPDEIAIYH